MKDDASPQTRDHGGDLDRAMERYGRGAWLDLSTGINAVPYPLPCVSEAAWARLPTKADLQRLEDAARSAYRTNAQLVALAGAQAAIQIVPRLEQPRQARVLAPTYNEHAASLMVQGWSVVEVTSLEDLAGADLAVVVNPNNPTGQAFAPSDLERVADQVGLLIVDESFADPMPDLSIAPALDSGNDGIVVLRSFGKFYGLAGLRLGFAIAGEALAERLRALVGPWAASGPAIEIGSEALSDAEWQNETRQRLGDDADRLDALAQKAGWQFVGGTPLFRTYETRGANAVQEHLARSLIWTRIFPYSARWVRFGLPGAAEDWLRLEQAMRGI